MINFLEDLREMGVLRGEEETGKGSHRWIYSPAMIELEFKQFIAKTILENLLRDLLKRTKARTGER